MDSKDRSNFLFVELPYTDRPYRLSKTSLSAVRKHVMNNYLQQHGNRKKTMHFRNRPSVAEKRQSPPQPVFSRLEGVETQTVTSASLPAIEPSSIEPSPTTVCSDINPSVFYNVREERYELPFSPTSLSSSFMVHQLDPFGVMPAAGTIHRDELLRWHSRPSEREHWEIGIPWLKVYNNNYVDSLWHVSKDHEGLFHIILCIGQARRAMEMGHDDHTLFYHHTKAMRYIRKQRPGKPFSLTAV